jgi:hypothetical protein
MLLNERRHWRVYIVATLLFLFSGTLIDAQAIHPNFRILAIAEHGGVHQPFVDAAKIWLRQEAIADNFAIDYAEDTALIDDAYLSHYQLFIQLNYPPYNWMKS